MVPVSDHPGNHVGLNWLSNESHRDEMLETTEALWCSGH